MVEGEEAAQLLSVEQEASPGLRYGLIGPLHGQTVRFFEGRDVYPMRGVRGLGQRELLAHGHEVLDPPGELVAGAGLEARPELAGIPGVCGSITLT